MYRWCLSTRQCLISTERHAGRREEQVSRVRNKPEKDEIALVVEGDNTPALEVGVLTEEGREHAANTTPESRAKIVENELRLVIRRTAVALRRVKPRWDCRGAEGEA